MEKKLGENELITKKYKGPIYLKLLPIGVIFFSGILGAGGTFLFLLVSMVYFIPSIGSHIILGNDGFISSQVFFGFNRFKVHKDEIVRYSITTSNGIKTKIQLRTINGKTYSIWFYQANKFEEILDFCQGIDIFSK